MVLSEGSSAVTIVESSKRQLLDFETYCELATLVLNSCYVNEGASMSWPGRCVTLKPNAVSRTCCKFSTTSQKNPSSILYKYLHKQLRRTHDIAYDKCVLCH
jgi:hypothetical protein